MSSVFNPNPNFSHVNFLLGSKSPRRRELLQMLDIEFDVVNIEVKENIDQPIADVNVAQFLAEKKSNGFTDSLQGSILITSDTTVLCEGHILNKPKNTNDALEMLRLLSGNKHEVHTGVCLRTEGAMKSFSECTRVYFKPLSQEEIEYYVEKYSPMDKAGSYGIQEWIGAIGIGRIEGCYYNVMGLPTSKLYTELCDFININF